MWQASHLLWLVAGVLGLLLGVTTGKLVIAALGLAAVITSIVALTVFSLVLQVIIWAILATVLAIELKDLAPAPVKKDVRPPPHGKVLRPIYPGQTGEVAYQGTTWKARCQVPDAVLEMEQPVQIVGREGNTLWVMPRDGETPVP
ncbi:MAG: NfeD family protein [Cyanobacteria bacterium P01_A01_bin.135]